MASSQFKNNGCIILWTDETEPTGASNDSNQNDRTHYLMEIAISPLAKGNAYNSTFNYTHFLTSPRCRSSEGMEENDGDGLGHVVEYDEKGRLVRDYRDKGKLNAPWGVIIAPPGFGKFEGDVLVSNFGDGTIAAFDRKSGKYVDNLRDAKGAPIVINKVWGMVFGNGVSLGDAHSLYFTAGPHNEFDGLFGKLTFDHPDTSKAAPASTAKL